MHACLCVCARAYTRDGNNLGKTVGLGARRPVVLPWFGTESETETPLCTYGVTKFAPYGPDRTFLAGQAFPSFWGKKLFIIIIILFFVCFCFHRGVFPDEALFRASPFLFAFPFPGFLDLIFFHS